MRHFRTITSLTSFALILALVLLVRTVSAQTSGQWVLQQKASGTGFTLHAVTGVNSRAFGLDSSGNLTMLSISSGSGSSEWGGITGTLSAQTDLAAALALKAPLASPTFTGTVTIPSGASISGYLTAAVAASTYQPLDSDLTSLAALTTAAFGRSLLSQTSAANVRTLIGAISSTDPTITNSLTINSVTTPTFNVIGPNGSASVEINNLTDARSYEFPDVSGTFMTTGNLTSITATGTITSGTWQGTAIALANGGTGQTTASTARIALLPSMTGNGGKFLRVNAGATDYEVATISGGGDALTSGSLDQFADVTQTATKTLAITESTTLAGGSHSGTNTGDQTTITGNAGTATALQTARTINGTSFDGTANVTITAAAGTLTGSTLASGVTGSSLTSLGTIATGVWQGTAIADSYVASAATWNAKQAGDADLTTYAGITPSANVQSLLGAADYAAMRSLFGLVIGTNVQAYDADLDDLADGSLTGTLVAAASTSARGSVELATDGETSASVVVQGNDNRLVDAERFEIGIAISDETTALTTGTAKVTFRMPYAMTVTAVRLSLTTVSSSGTPTVDINEAGTTILSTKLTCDASEKTSTTAATAAVISDTALADDAEITLDIDTAGTGATGAKVWIIGTR
jgi:hypothetical protein